MTVRIIKDDMQGLFASAREAYEAGEKSARARLYTQIMLALTHVSVKHQKAGDVTAFRTAEECCEAVRMLRQKTELH